MKALPLVLLNAVVAAGIVLAGFALRGGGAPDTIARDRAARDDGTSAALEKRLASIEGRLEVIEVSVASLGSDLARRDEGPAPDLAAVQEEIRALKAVVEAGAAAPETGAAPEAAKPEPDAFAREVSKAIRQNISQEFKRISDLILAPTPEAEAQRRRQIEGIAQMFGRQAGLDDGQVTTLQNILLDTDMAARDELRPVLQETDDYTRLDYGRLKTITSDSFEKQDRRFEESFPKDKAESLKRTVAPIRTMFSAMLDELERQGKADTGGGAK